MRRRKLATLLLAACVCAVLVSTAAAGLVSSLLVAKRTLAGKTTSIVVDRRGDAVYELGGESLGHLQCVTARCLNLWPPVEVRSAGFRPPKAPAVPGRLSILRRVKADLYQVMLDQHPLYFYSGDIKVGSTNGQGVKSFGGTWHVIKTS